jgi:hypothetical protein
MNENNTTRTALPSVDIVEAAGLDATGRSGVVTWEDVTCAWGDHVAAVVGTTPNGVAICAACAALSGLAVR